MIFGIRQFELENNYHKLKLLEDKIVLAHSIDLLTERNLKVVSLPNLKTQS